MQMNQSTHNFFCLLAILSIFIGVQGFSFCSISTNYNTAATSASHRRTHQHQNMSNNSGDDSQLIRAGFIGCGTIASSIASGLANPNHAEFLSHNSLVLSSIHVTRRSESRSSQLKQSYPNVVTVCETAKEVVKNSEIVFLCVLPIYVDEVLEELEGAWEGQTLVSLVVCTSGTSSFMLCWFKILSHSPII